jgi:hypothetical protein
VPVNPEYQLIDRFKDEIRLAPKASSERFVGGPLGICLDSEHHTMFVRERAAQNDEASIHKPILERGVGGPIVLLLRREPASHLRLDRRSTTNNAMPMFYYDPVGPRVAPQSNSKQLVVAGTCFALLCRLTVREENLVTNFRSAITSSGRTRP